MKSSLQIVITMLCIVSRLAFAGDCEALVKYGIFDSSESSNSSAKFEQVKAWACHTSASDISTARTDATNAGIGIDIFSLDFGNTKATQNFQQWKDNLCSSDSSTIQGNQQATKIIKSASKVLTSAFLECLITPGFHAWVEQTSDTSFVVKAKFIPYPSSSPHADTSATIESFNIDPKDVQDSCQGASLLAVGQTISNNGREINCLRDPSKDVRFTINSTAEPYSFTLKRDPPLAPPQTAPDLSTESGKLACANSVFANAKASNYFKNYTFKTDWRDIDIVGAPYLPGKPSISRVRGVALYIIPDIGISLIGANKAAMYARAEGVLLACGVYQIQSAFL